MTSLPFRVPKTCSDKREARQQNITEKKYLNAVSAESHTQKEDAKASRPKPRRVQPQLKGSGIGESLVVFDSDAGI